MTSALPSIVSRADLAALKMTRHKLYSLVDAGELEHIAPGYYVQPGRLDDTSAAWASVSLRNPSATICLLSALSIHDLTDEIPAATDIALPRGQRSLVTRFAPVRWHSFDPSTFHLGRTDHPFADISVTIGLYSAQRSIIDAFRLRHEIGPDVANEALKRWLLQRGNQPSSLLEMARSFPRAQAALRTSLEILL